MIGSIFEFDGKISSTNPDNYRKITELKPDLIADAKHHCCKDVQCSNGKIYYDFESIFYQIELLQGFLNRRFFMDLKPLTFYDDNGYLCWDEECCTIIFLHSFISLMQTDPENFGEYAGRKQRFLAKFLADDSKLQLTREFINKHSCHSLVRRRQPEFYAQVFPNEGLFGFLSHSFANQAKTSSVPFADPADLEKINKKDEIPVAQEVVKRRSWFRF